MGQEKIKIVIKKDATIDYQVEGVKGKSCTEVSKFIDQLGKVVETKTTPEYNQAETERNRIKTR